MTRDKKITLADNSSITQDDYNKALHIGLAIRDEMSDSISILGIRNIDKALSVGSDISLNFRRGDGSIDKLFGKTIAACFCPENIAAIMELGLSNLYFLSGDLLVTPESGCSRIDLSCPDAFIEELKRGWFDSVIIAYGERFFADQQIESLLGSVCRSVYVVYPNRKIRHYTGDNYDRLQYNRTYLRSMFRFAPNLHHKKVLEVGCSDRLTCDIIANEQPGTVIGIDMMPLSPSGFDDPRVTYSQMDAHSLEFSDNTFDLCYSIATFEHCTDPFTVLQEMKRVTKAGGVCYIQAAPLYYSPWGHHIFGYFDDYPWIHLRKTTAEIIDYCRSNGIAKVLEEKGQNIINFIEGNINQKHINGKRLVEYRLDEFMGSPDIEVLNFERTYEGINLLTPEISKELSHLSAEDLVSHGFELVFRNK